MRSTRLPIEIDKRFEQLIENKGSCSYAELKKAVISHLEATGY